PHRVHGTFDRGLNGAVLTEAVGRDEERDLLDVRAPQGLHAGGGDVAGSLGVVVSGSSRADDDDEGLAVVRCHTVRSPGAGLALRDAVDDGLYRTRQARRRAAVAAKRD